MYDVVRFDGHMRYVSNVVGFVQTTLSLVIWELYVVGTKLHYQYQNGTQNGCGPTLITWKWYTEWLGTNTNIEMVHRMGVGQH